MNSTSTWRSPPAIHPFSLYLASADPLKIYPDSAVDLANISSHPDYALPFMEHQDIDQIVAYLEAGKVVDPLNLVLWGADSPDQILTFVQHLDGWTGTSLSSPFWGFFEGSGGSRHTVETQESIGQATVGWANSVVVLTKIYRAFARHHVRVFEPFDAGSGWGYVALVGAHTEALGRVGKWKIWHRVRDWNEARDLFTDSAMEELAVEAFEIGEYHTEGRWQGHAFDGQIVLIQMP